MDNIQENNPGMEKIDPHKKVAIITVLGTAIIIILAVALTAYFWIKTHPQLRLQESMPANEESAEKITEDATKGTLPSISNNPLKNH